MKKLNQAWRNQKTAPAQVSVQNTLSKEERESLLKPANTTTRRRLGRFALSARPASVVKKLSPTTHGLPVETADDDRFPTSFMSSDLLAEMDKVEAAMNLSPNRTARKCTTIAHDSCKSDQSIIENLKSSVPKTYENLCAGNKRKAVKQSSPHIAGEKQLYANTRLPNSKILSHDEKLMRVNSPTSSPLDKKPKLNSRTSQEKTTTGRTKASIQKNNLSFPTPEGRFYGRKCKEPIIKLKGDFENDISFSPLLETPNISDSSGEENEISEKYKQNCSVGNSVNKHKKTQKTKTTLNVIETPKRSSAQKRRSPKNILSPDVKISKSTINDLSSRGQITGCIQETKINDPNLTPNDRSEMVIPKIASPPLKSNSNDLQSRQHADNISKEHSISEASPGFISIASSTTINTSANVSLTEDKRLLKSWGLPEPVLAAYQKQGVTTMFEWQAECLLSPSVLDGGNLIYSAPTSAGKTLVAEILVLKRVLETRKKALVILPFVSVAREKMFSLQRLYQDAGIRVGGYMGSHSPAGGFSALDVAVCTIEKGNGLVNRMMEDGRINDIGVVVVDELHMVGDSHRGYLLELMLTKLEFLSLKRESDQRLQIIGMSATLPNLEVLAKWLGAALYRTNYRPVPLSEHIKVDNRIYDSQLVPQGEVPARYISPDDTDHVLALCLETVMTNHSVLLFCPTKNWCEKLCETIARKFYQITHSQAAAATVDNSACKENDDHGNRLKLNKAGLRDSLEQLRRCPVGVDPMLGKCIINGVAYHHAGLTFDERDIIEGAFREGNLRVLIATSTLSSGVNLPARRVIIRTPMFHGKVIDVLTFKQMSGRAGRKGVDTEGESILICKPGEKMKGKSLLKSELPPVESCLYFDEESGLSRSLKRAILEVVVSGVTSSPEDVMSYINCTLLSASMTDNTDAGSGPCTSSLIKNCITFLQDNEFVSMQTVKKEDGTECKKFFPTQLGSAILASSLSPDEGLLVFAELQKARRSFVLETELHVIYLVTPVYTTDIATSIDWYHFYTLWENLSPAERRVADLVGVKEGFIAQAIGGRINRKTETQRKAMAVHHRFYTALVLNTLVREIPLMEVATKFNLNKGQLQSLQQSAATYTGMLTVFCQRLGWHNLELILSRFQRRLSMGVQHELVDLVRISALTASSARMLYNAGYHTVADVARAEDVEVEELFKTAVPFQSDKKQEGETDWERKERQKVKCIWLTGRKGMTELDAAKEIIQEAKGIVQGDLGVKEIAWNLKDSASLAASSDESGSEDEEKCFDRDNQEDGIDRATVKNDESDKENRMRNDVDKIPNASQSNFKTVERGELDLNKQQHETASSGSSNFTKMKSRLSIKETCSSKGKRKSLSCNTMSVVKDIIKDPGKSQRHSPEQKEECHNNRHENNKTIDRDQNYSNIDISHKTQTSNSGRWMTRKKSTAIGRKSEAHLNRSKCSERSFFGQVVVTPPPGLSPLVNDRNKSKVYVANSFDVISDEVQTSDDNTHQRTVGQSSQVILDCFQQSQGKSSSQDRNDMSISRVGKGNLFNRSGCFNGEDNKKDKERHTCSNENANIKQLEKAICTKGGSPATSNLACHIKSSAVNNNDNISFSISENSKIGTSVSNMPSESNEQNCEIVYGSKNSSYISESLSFSESFILDTQTAALINAGCNELIAKEKNPADNVIDNSCGMANELDTPQKQSLLMLSTNNSSCIRKPSSKSSSGFDGGKTGYPSQALELCKRSEEDLMQNKDEIDDSDSLSLDQSRESVSIFYSSPTNVSVSKCTIESATKPSKQLEKDNNNKNPNSVGQDDCDDEPDSLLVSSCYERISNFDEGMLECSGYNDFGVNDSLSELNILRNSATPDILPKRNTVQTYFAENQESKSKATSNSQKDERNQLLSSTHNILNQISDTQCTDDSLLAAVDMDGLTPLASHHGANTGRRSNYDMSIIKLRPENNFAEGARRESKDELTSKRSESLNVDPTKQAPNPSENSIFLSDSLSASLVDQAFAQCDMITMKTSSPNNNNNLLQQTRTHKLLIQHSTCTTPMSKNNHPNTTGAHVDISPVLWDNPDSSSNSLNNSSCHDGSDCVPPTPPDEVSSHASPYKLAFLSPMASRNKIRSPGNSNRKIKETNPKAVVNEKLLTRKHLAKKCSLRFKDTDNDVGISDSENDINLRSTFDLQSECLNDSLNNDDGSHENMHHANGCNRDQITSQSQLFTQQSFTIIDVCAHRDLFQTFLNEWRSKSSFSLGLACEKLAPVTKKKSPTGIGCRFNKKKNTRQSMEASAVPEGLTVPNAGVQLVGIAVTWEHRDAYYISLMTDNHREEDKDPEDSLAEPPLCESIPLQERINSVVTYLQTRLGHKPQTVQTYDTKTVYTTLAKTLGVSLEKCEDPRVADWLREPGSRLKNLHRMVTTYLPDELSLLEEVGGGSSYQGLGFDIKSRVSGRIRACTESILTHKLMVEYRQMMEDQELWQAFERTEMPALLTLSRMELNGFGLSMSELESQKSLMKAKLDSIEQTAYKMAGHVFSLTSLDDIAKILYLELKLPLNGDPNAVPHLPTRGTRNRRTVGGTSKEILEKLTKFHSLPALILEWRRISSALTKSLFALQRAAQHCDRLDMVRVFGDCQVFSATGRVSMAEPNIQNIPKDFCVDFKDLQKEPSSNTDQHILSQSVRMRRMFVPFKGGVILSADYSQLELRIIAHLSGDNKLGHILNTEGGDVFKLIAAQFKSLDVEEVTPSDRQQAKQVCYGMLYGIGPKALGEQIGVCENEATVFMETFKSTYPGVRKYLRETVEFCQKNGYVKTLFNRRRYLPSIKHTNPHARAQAERQAVNTSVQGSAADLVKKAMTSIDLKLMEVFPDCRTTHSQCSVNVTKKTPLKPPQGGFFLLQLHDELIYEVNVNHLDVVARLVKKEMEGACRLCVRMPVKVNVGPSWGQLEEYDFTMN